MNLTIKAVIVFVLIIILSIFLRVFIGEPCHISSASMEPTIMVGDWLWINKSSYGALMPARCSDIPLINIFTWNSSMRKKDMESDWGYHRIKGWRIPQEDDIIVFKSPEDKKVLLVKRMVEWLPIGSMLTIDIKNCQRYKSIILQEGNSLELRNNSLYINNRLTNIYKIKNGYCFVIGDNSGISRDSRFFGYVCEKDIIGKISGVIFSTKDRNRFLRKLE